MANRIPRLPLLCLCMTVLPCLATVARADPIADLRRWIAQPPASRPDLQKQPCAVASLNKSQAAQARAMLMADRAQSLRAARQKEWDSHELAIGQHTLKWKEKHFGNKPADGWNLFISLHGGGNAPPALNDQQWENQIHLYQPKDSLYICPRAPTNTWNLWHESHMDALLDRLIEDACILGQANPNRVYIMGYSAGGDGVYQLAPRMADRFTAASMMAGHPNDASPLGLRNIGFAIHVGALDNGFNRNKVAAEWGKKLDELERSDPGAYPHVVQLHAGRAHWMNLEDRVAVDWMLRFTRNPLPQKIVWKQAGVTHDAFYWLQLPPTEPAKPGQLIIASRKGQEVQIEQAQDIRAINIRLNDVMVDLDRPVSITMNGKSLYKGIAGRSISQIATSISERSDPAMIFDASVTVQVSR